MPRAELSTEIVGNSYGIFDFGRQMSPNRAELISFGGFLDTSSLTEGTDERSIYCRYTNFQK